MEINHHPDYPAPGLDRDLAPENPMELFASWFQEFRTADQGSDATPNAMALATVSQTGQPRVRTVLLQGFSESGFVFYTNYLSAKARELNSEPRASALLYSSHLHRQIRIEGQVQAASATLSDSYFAGRPRGNQVAAWASAQSEPINRQELVAKVLETEQRFEGSRIPRPDFWGGYQLQPDMLEFWQGQPSRLHDRLEYRLQEGVWHQRVLAP